MPLREETVVLYNKVYSANKVWKNARARACRLNINNDSSNNVQGYRRCFMLHRQMFASSRSPLFFARCGANFFCKFWYQIQYCFEFSALNLTVKMSNETQFSITEFIYWAFGRNVVSTVEPWFNKPLYEEVLSITNDFCGPSKSEQYWKEPWYNKTLLYM